MGTDSHTRGRQARCPSVNPSHVRQQRSLFTNGGHDLAQELIEWVESNFKRGPQGDQLWMKTFVCQRRKMTIVKVRSVK